MDDDFNGGMAAESKRETNGGGSSQFGTPVTTFSGGSRGGSTDIASLDAKVSDGVHAQLFSVVSSLHRVHSPVHACNELPT